MYNVILCFSDFQDSSVYIERQNDVNSYLPGTDVTVILKAVRPERGLDIALRQGWLLRLLQMRVTRVRYFW